MENERAVGMGLMASNVWILVYSARKCIHIQFSVFANLCQGLKKGIYKSYNCTTARYFRPNEIKNLNGMRSFTMYVNGCVYIESHKT